MPIEVGVGSLVVWTINKLGREALVHCFHLTSDLSHLCGLFWIAFPLKCLSRLRLQFEQLVHTHLVPGGSNLHK